MQLGEELKDINLYRFCVIASTNNTLANRIGRVVTSTQHVIGDVWLRVRSELALFLESSKSL